MNVLILLFYLSLVYCSYCSVQRAGIEHKSALTLQSTEHKEGTIIGQNTRNSCQYTDFRWSSCICDRNVMIGIRFLVNEKAEDCAPEVTIIELPCDKSSCNQKLLSTSDGVACPSLANIDGVCDSTKGFLTDVMAKSFEMCRAFCSVMVNCTYFILDAKNSRCKLYTGNKICGKEAPGITTGLAGFNENSCSECSVGTWGGLSECKRPEDFDPDLLGCGEAVRTRISNGNIDADCPYRTETWTCSLPGQTCDMRTEISDIYLKSKPETDNESDSYKLLEISLIFAGIVTGILIFVPTSLIFPKIGQFFYGKRLYSLLSGNEIDSNRAHIDETTNNVDDYEEWEEDDMNVEYETEFTIDNK
ncbi:TSP1 domain-containing protein TSP6 precursor [Cryptosporidium ubiquitum]|uniref:TSP1 domain-containing protein TSP6 n=1 Tax=Cryptosporidium ubiquitum TaxID=857276 RepID=A0A1J4MJC2_9CRYT|nr:TSP1 domain-containing protein TSP6 precursor [Cryptosporidium ubiquitum]OII73124.1 TSP1 domain-containing protein TSP6 precursor [Cryptosporidium ubiquitum]